MNLWQTIKNLLPARIVSDRVYVPSRQAGVFVSEDTAMTLAGWWACISAISRTIASLPWRVHERTEQGSQVVDGSVSWLLNTRPNPEMSAFAFREALVSHALNWGNGFAEIERDMAGRVSALWLITPDRVGIERDTKTGALQYRVRNEGADDTILTPDRVFHLHGLGFDGISGYSIVRMAARSIGLGIAQDVFGAAFYGNGATVGSIVEMPAASMTAAQIADAEKYFNDKHGGAANAFKVRVGPQGTKVHPMGMPLIDAQFIDSRKLSVTECARWLGVPPHKIADLERSTNNNIEHQGIEFVTDAIVPWAMRLEQEAAVKLFAARAQGRVYTKLAVNALMRGDSKARAEFYRTMLAAGVMTVNEVRALEELNSIGPAGDAHLVQLAQTTLEWLVDNPGAKAAPPAAPAAETAPADDPPEPANVIRMQALDFIRSQKRQENQA